MGKHKKIEWEGEEYTLPELARKFGMAWQTLRYRLEKGLSLEEALDSRRLEKKRTTRSGESDTIRGWADRTGIDAHIIRRRIEQGWSVDDAVEVTPRDRSLRIKWQGKFYSVAELAKKCGVSESGLRYRLGKGLPVEEALTPKSVKVGRPGKTLTSGNGETHTIPEWSKKLGIPHKTLHTRLSQGWEPDEILGFVNRPRTRRKGETP